MAGACVDFLWAGGQPWGGAPAGPLWPHAPWHGSVASRAGGNLSASCSWLSSHICSQLHFTVIRDSRSDR